MFNGGNDHGSNYNLRIKMLGVDITNKAIPM